MPSSLRGALGDMGNRNRDDLLGLGAQRTSGEGGATERLERRELFGRGCAAPIADFCGGFRVEFVSHDMIPCEAGAAVSRRGGVANDRSRRETPRLDRNQISSCLPILISRFQGGTK